MFTTSRNRSELKQGERIGGYTLVERIGQSDICEVWEAATPMGELFALKLAKPGLSSRDRATVNRNLAYEWNIARGLRHPGIVTCYEFVSGSTPALVMQRLPGMSLHEHIQRYGPLSWERFEPLAAQIIRALLYMHRQGGSHLDLKPRNIMVTPFGAVLIDFGLTRVTRDSPLTQAGLSFSGHYLDDTEATVDTDVVSSPAYSAPERAALEQCGTWSDIYSLGATFYHALTGKLPFNGSIEQQIEQHAHAEIPRLPWRVRLRTPAAIIRLITACLSKKPADRPSTEEALGVVKFSIR